VAAFGKYFLLERMEYVPGKNLRAIFERMKRTGTQMPFSLAVWVMSRLLDGLDYAHRKRDPSGRDRHIVHRDVSPQNVIQPACRERPACPRPRARPAKRRAVCWGSSL
jgi:hypothetical protein